VTLERGTLVLVDLEPSLGHEQQGTRPCVVLSDEAVNSSQRFPLIAVVSATGALYPALAAVPSDLTQPSIALVDQLRSIDKQRIRKRYGHVSPQELEAIEAGLCLYLGLEPSQDNGSTPSRPIIKP
jgi:mRNA interferase MazF